MARRLRALIPETEVHIFEYRSRHHSLEEVADQLADFIDATTRGAPVSFVAHSLGGLIVRAVDARANTQSPLKRLITLGSPHQGSSVARLLSRSKLLSAIGGPILSQLATPPLPNRAQHLEIGCIIGATGTRFGFFPLLPGDNDGLVSTAEAILPGARSTLEIAMVHALFPFSSRATLLAARFLQQGHF